MARNLFYDKVVIPRTPLTITSATTTSNMRTFFLGRASTDLNNALLVSIYFGVAMTFQQVMDLFDKPYQRDPSPVGR